MAPNQPAWNLDRVFGREKESAALNDAIDKSPSKQTTVILHGVAGSGKSSLIGSQPWDEKGWVLASGKFEQHRTGEPFTAIIQAFNGLVEQWMENNKMASVCQLYNLSSLLEEDLDLLQYILPKAYTTHGACPRMANKKKHYKKKRSSSFTSMEQDIGAADCTKRSLGRILAFLCQAKPVVLFIDDVHWADQSSLSVLKYFASGCGGGVDNLVLALSYRDEDLAANELAAVAVEEIKALDGDDQRIQDIAVRDLDVDSVNRIVASVTLRDEEETMPLSEVLHKKTAGNPFFVTQFLRMLRQEDFMTFSFLTFKWEWGDIARLESAAHVADNVADIVAGTMRKLPESTRVALNVAACLGKVVPVDVLVEYFEYYNKAEAGKTCAVGLHQIKMRGLQAVLQEAVEVGVLIRPEGQDTFMWAHDKLQTVAYSLIPHSCRSSLHIRLGQLLWKMRLTNPGEEWMVFMAADQMNRFSDHQQDQSLGLVVASLCFEAAKLSLSKSALYPALDMLKAAVKHLDIEGKWTKHGRFTVKLYSTLAELAHSLGQNDEAMKAVDAVEANAPSFEDKFRVQCIKLKCLVSGTDRNFKLGAEKTLEILKEYGVVIPKKLYPGQLFLENHRLKSALPGGKLEGLMELPEAEDSRFLKIITLVVSHLNVYLPKATKMDRNIGWYTNVQAIKKSIEFGVCQETAVAIGNLAWAMRVNGDYKEALEYAELSIKLVKRFPMGVGSKHAGVIGTASAGIYTATRPLHSVLDIYMEGHHVALKVGNTELAALSIMAYLMGYVTVGLPLGPLASDIPAYVKEARQFSMPETVVAVFQIIHQAVLNLQEDVENPTVLKGAALDEDTLMDKFSGNAVPMTKRDLYAFRLMLANIYGYWDVAETLVDALEPFLYNDNFLLRASMRSTAMAIASFQIARRTGKKKYRTLAKKIMKEVKEELRRGNVNSHSIYTVLEAEAHPSKERYDAAIKSCARLGFIHYEAYMCECAANMFLEQGDEGWAEYYMSQAFVLYDDWGATGKVNRMKEEHPELLKSSSLREKGTNALKGRARYSSKHTDDLKDMNWNKLSISSSNRGSVSKGDSDTTSETRSNDSINLQGGNAAQALFAPNV